MMARCGLPALWAPALAALILLASPADGARAVRACRAGCKEPFRACRAEAAASAVASQASCGGSAQECRAQTQRIRSGARRACKSFRKSCRACCKRGGPDCTRPPEVPRVTGTFVLPERRVLETTTDFPPAPSGRGFMLLPLPDGVLGFDPFTRTPVTAAAECAAAVLACYAPGERNWAGCFVAVPGCSSDAAADAPMCCAPGCLDRFQALLREGRDGASAFAGAIYEAPSCMPGVDAFVGRGGSQ